jgi:hypothetical protein
MHAKFDDEGFEDTELSLREIRGRESNR